MAIPDKIRKRDIFKLLVGCHHGWCAAFGRVGYSCTSLLWTYASQLRAAGYCRYQWFFLLKLNFLASDDISGSLCVPFLCVLTYALQVTFYCGLL